MTTDRNSKKKKKYDIKKMTVAYFYFISNPIDSTGSELYVRFMAHCFHG